MTISNLPTGFNFAPAGAKVDARAAAREFEALLIARLLKTAREAGEPLSDPLSEAGADGYRELAEEHVARVMAQSGCFGIARMVLQGLTESEAVGAASVPAAETLAGRPAVGTAEAPARGTDGATETHPEVQ